MNEEQLAQFYATILSGLIANPAVGGFPEDKISLAISTGDRLLQELYKRSTKRLLKS